MVITQAQTDLFIQGYLTAALWSSSDTVDDETFFLDEFQWGDGVAEKLHADCIKFVNDNAEKLIEYSENVTHSEEYDAFELAGHDFWLTRSGHGAGFWDRGLGQLGQDLTNLTKTYSELYLYLGEDECVYTGL